MKKTRLAPLEVKTRCGSSRLLTGFTLIEILITIGIFIAVLTAFLTLYLLTQKFYQKTQDQAEVLQNGRVVLERLSRELRQAVEIITALPQTPDSPENPPVNEIEFEDGHHPSPYQDLGSDYYYIRYYLDEEKSEIIRQYRVYCFEDCLSCLSYTRWNDLKMEGEEQISPHPCNLEERVVGEYARSFTFWGSNLVYIGIDFSKHNESLRFETNVSGRNF